MLTTPPFLADDSPHHPDRLAAVSLWVLESDGAASEVPLTDGAAALLVGVGASRLVDALCTIPYVGPAGSRSAAIGRHEDVDGGGVDVGYVEWDADESDGCAPVTAALLVAGVTDALRDGVRRLAAELSDGDPSHHRTS
jgi:hypothetical protein